MLRLITNPDSWHLKFRGFFDWWVVNASLHSSSVSVPFFTAAFLDKSKALYPAIRTTRLSGDIESSAQECQGLWSCYSSHSVLVPHRTNMLVSCSLLQVGSLVVRQWIWIALFLPFLRDVIVNVILSLSWQQLRIPYINRIWICCLYIGLTELKNAAFDAMAYRTSRTLCGGNGVEPYAKMESIFFVRFLLI